MSESTVVEVEHRSSRVSLKLKFLLVGLSWLVALLIAMPAFHIESLCLIYDFPVGLFSMLSFIEGDLDENFLLELYWFIYGALVLTTLMMTRKKWFYICWGIMTAILLLNAGGCRMIWAEL